MRITHSTAAERAAARTTPASAGRPWLELLALLLASLVSLTGTWLAYRAKAAEFSSPPLAVAVAPLDLATVDRAEQLLPALETVVTDPAERRFVADRIAGWLTTPDGSGDLRRRPQSVQALSLIRVTEADVRGNRRLASFRQRLAERRAQQQGPVRPKPDSKGAPAAPLQPDAPAVSVPLLTAAQMSALRPALAVRAWPAFRNRLLLACALFFVAFYVPWIVGLVRRLPGDPLLVPAVHVLCGVGFALMISLRDPLRDVPLFARFAQGVLAGGVGIALVRLVDFQRSQIRRLSFVPLLGAIALSALLIVFGSGPGTSDAKVNLLGVQPVEAIRVLVVLFLAGYFASRWELLRSLKEPRLGAATRLGLEVPRLDYVVPVLVGMALILVFFFLQKDLGPALVLACVFLAMYGVARRRLTMVGVGLLLLGSGFLGGYLLGFPRTVVQRVQMWLSPWDNVVRGGDQIAHALWALAAGAVTGTGIGLGDPQFIPAGHTDLILAVAGEELGFVGLVVVFALFAFVGWRCLHVALRATGDYTFFLALGLTLGLVLQVTLIAAGLLGLMPLTGVATPFLSYGRSSMIANLVALGIILAIGARSETTEAPKPEFERPALVLAGVVGVLLLAALGRAAMVQVVNPDRTLIAPALSVQADGERRFEYNPRLLAVAQQIDRGTIFDRNGIPLATSRPADLTAGGDLFKKLGLAVPPGCAAGGRRCYPFAGLTYHLLGDFRAQTNWAASNTSFVERDSDARLRGYDDHARVVEVVDPRNGAKTRILRRDLTELIPLLRKRRHPEDEAVKRLLARPRDVRVSVDVRLQLKLADAVRNGIEQAGRKEGAAVVLSGDGDVLAAVSYPWPLDMPDAASAPPAATHSVTPEEHDAALLDRVRYGVYPPGSSFKLVTASAALRKDAALLRQSFTCQRLPDGRVGQKIPGWGRPIRDDPADKTPHGTLDLERALVVSCNAYFAQLGLHIGPQALQETADLYEIAVAAPGNPRALRDTLPFAAYGQGHVLASPLKMARVAATIGGGGAMPQGRWVIDETNTRVDTPVPVLAPADAQTLARAMREVVLQGTGRSLKGIEPAIAGKTGTAEVQDAPSHSWFVGFAPYGEAKRRIAFAVIVEHGGYGASVAAPIAGRLVTAAKELGLVE
jgi:cell division protein FtsW (lipid II flippase)/cell division protein FtsI/penicillin-binding protein 2